MVTRRDLREFTTDLIVLVIIVFMYLLSLLCSKYNLSQLFLDCWNFILMSYLHQMKLNIMMIKFHHMNTCINKYIITFDEILRYEKINFLFMFIL